MIRTLIKPVSVLSAFSAFFILVACGPKSNNPQPRQSDFPVATAVQPTHDPKRLSDGVWKVGLEIEVGTYTTVVPADATGCYWARLRNFLNEPSSIIANGLFTPNAKGRLTIKATDVGVEFTGDCIWVKEK